MDDVITLPKSRPGWMEKVHTYGDVGGLSVTLWQGPVPLNKHLEVATYDEPENVPTSLAVFPATQEGRRAADVFAAATLTAIETYARFAAFGGTHVPAANGVEASASAVPRHG